MRFQSAIRNHAFIVKPTVWVRTPGQSPYLDRGASVKFTGPQRIFDSQDAKRRFNWSEETLEQVERFILADDDYGVKIFLAPGETLPEKYQDSVRVKSELLERTCSEIWLQDGDVVRCPNEPSAGREKCPTHDPDEPKISKGLGTTA